MDFITKKINQKFDSIDIIEKHHKSKLDKPSGTALRTQQLIEKESTIHSIRSSGFLAEQSIVFANLGEVLTIESSVSDRTCYMPCILLACEKAIEIKELYYGIENLISFK